MKFGKEPEMDNPYEPPPRWGLFVLLGLAALTATGIAAWGWYAWNANHRQVEPVPAGQSARLVWELENSLQKISAQLVQLTDDGVSDQRVELLAEAVAAQNDLLRARAAAEPGDILRLHDLQTQLDSARGQQRNTKISRLEAEGEPLLAGDRKAEGIAMLKQALTLQQEINGSGATSGVKNFAREERLDQRLQRLEAEPLHAQARVALARAEAATKAGQWPEALAAYREARDLQDRLNRDFGRRQFSDLAVIERIDTEIASLGAMGLHAQVEENLRQARAAAAAGREADAAAIFQLAATAQKQINTQFAKSRFVSNELQQQIDAEQQTAQAAAELREVRAADAETAGHLRKREIVLAQKNIRTALAQLEALVVRMPKARGIDEELRLRLGYLNLRQEELRPVQDLVYAQLLPQPGAENSALLKVEVTQALFTAVMNANPSRNAGPGLPVDSVNYAEAQEFSRRLGWIMGTRVRLPSEAEFRRALGKISETSPANWWTAENSGGHSQPVAQKPANPAGFFDLLGNVAEWLADDENDSVSAPRAGGSYATPATEFGALPVERAPRAERARTTGFRVVVEIDLRAK